MEQQKLVQPVVIFGSLLNLTNSYRIEISTGGQTLYSKRITSNGTVEAIEHTVETSLNPGTVYQLEILPLFNETVVEALQHSSIYYNSTSSSNK